MGESKNIKILPAAGIERGDVFAGLFAASKIPYSYVSIALTIQRHIELLLMDAKKKITCSVLLKMRPKFLHGGLLALILDIYSVGEGP